MSLFGSKNVDLGTERTRILENTGARTDRAMASKMALMPDIINHAGADRSKYAMQASNVDNKQAFSANAANPLASVNQNVDTFLAARNAKMAEEQRRLQSVTSTIRGAMGEGDTAGKGMSQLARIKAIQNQHVPGVDLGQIISSGVSGYMAGSDLKSVMDG